MAVTLQTLQDAQSGDHAATECLMEELYTPIFHFLLKRTGSIETAHDLIQTTFLKCYREIDTYKESHGSVKTWMFRIARNTLFDYYRKVRSEPYEDLRDLAIADDVTSDTTYEAERLQNERYIAKLLGHLTDEEADIVTLRALEDMPYIEIAHIVGKTEDAVRKAYSRSLEKLRTLVTQSTKYTP